MKTPRSRNLLLSNYVTRETVEEIIKEINAINHSDRIMFEEYGDRYIIEPIILSLNTYGGDVYAGLALVDAIKNSAIPVFTIATGACMSMGVPILLSGKRRFITENATLMVHSITGGAHGNIGDLKVTTKEFERLQKIIDKMITDNSNITQARLDSIAEKKKDWYLSAEKAVELGLARPYAEIFEGGE